MGTKEECSRAASALGYSKIVEAHSADFVPKGCLVGPISASPGAIKTSFNSKKGKSGNNMFRSICKQPPYKTWRDDLKCGSNYWIFGEPAQCDPNGASPCCSPSGRCGHTAAHCD